MPLRRPFFGVATSWLRALFVAIATVLFTGAAGWTLPASAESLRVGGTGAGLAVMGRLAEMFAEKYPGLETAVVPSLGSSGGIKALLAGAIDVSVSARPLKEKEVAAGAVADEFARTPFVLATRVATPVGLTRAELVRIYAGEATAWPDGSPIRIVLRPATDSDTLLLREMSGDMNRAVDAAFAQPGMIEAQTDQENAELLETLDGSIGTSTLGQIVSEKRQLRALAVDGVAPTKMAAASGRYVWHKGLLVVRLGDAPSSVRAFIDFVLSPDAASILEENGFWVADGKTAAR